MARAAAEVLDRIKEAGVDKEEEPHCTISGAPGEVTATNPAVQRKTTNGVSQCQGPPAGRQQRSWEASCNNADMVNLRTKERCLRLLGKHRP